MTENFSFCNPLIYLADVDFVDWFLQNWMYQRRNFQYAEHIRGQTKILTPLRECNFQH
jgi:hypothetical protein